MPLRRPRSEAKTDHAAGVTTITFTEAKIRDEADMLGKELRGRTDHLGRRRLLLDFTNVRFFTGDELGTLLKLNHKMRGAGGRLTLSNLNPALYELFEVTKLNTVMEVHREEPPTSEAIGYRIADKEKQRKSSGKKKASS